MIKPLEDRVVIEPIVSADKTPGGIIIPTNAKEKSQEGTVIAVGPGRYYTDLFVRTELKVGDKVLYGKYSGVAVELDRKDYIILRESDILAKL
jgi:chaperonin GroES